MAARYRGDIFDLSGMTDDEIYDLVLETLREHPEVDTGWIEVRVDAGHVTLSGRVGSDGEAQVAEAVVTQTLGIEEFTSELMVDELHRGELPEAADDAIAAEQDVDDQLGTGTGSQSDTAAHLAPDEGEELYGTHDMGRAIEDGTSYNPPDRPMGDGYGSRERH